MRHHDILFILKFLQTLLFCSVYSVCQNIFYSLSLAITHTQHINRERIQEAQIKGKKSQEWCDCLICIFLHLYEWSAGTLPNLEDHVAKVHKVQHSGHT